MSQSNIPTTFVLAPGLLTPSAPQKEVPQPAFPPPDFLVNPEFSEAVWSVGGALLYDNAVVEFFKFVRSEIPALRIRDVFGAPPCIWTLDWYRTRRLIPPGDFSAQVKNITSLKINFSLDFDNPFVTKEELNDLVGDTFLRSLDQTPDAHVSVASELLADAIRKRFPRMKIRAGANKAVAENAQGDLDYYLRAAEKFETTVLHPADAINADFLEKLATRVPAKKFEIVVNDTCLRDCPLRREHLEALSKIRRAPWDAALLRQRHALLARAGCENVTSQTGNAASVLTRNEWKRAYEIGFRNFKIQAEKLRSELAFFYELGAWMLNDDPQFWHKKSAFLASSVNNIRIAEPAVKTGASAFVLRKYE